MSEEVVTSFGTLQHPLVARIAVIDSQFVYMDSLPPVLIS
jgi:hypothetical protein